MPAHTKRYETPTWYGPVLFDGKCELRPDLTAAARERATRGRSQLSKAKVAPIDSESELKPRPAVLAETVTVDDRRPVSAPFAGGGGDIAGARLAFSAVVARAHAAGRRCGVVAGRRSRDPRQVQG